MFEPNSYGFRCGRSCQDAIAQNFIRVKSDRDTWVLEADIQGFFDNIAHESILNQLGSFPRKDLIKRWLKAGFIFEGKYNLTERGTPQGGVCSPLKRQYRIAWTRNIYQVHQLKIWSGQIC